MSDNEAARFSAATEDMISAVKVMKDHPRGPKMMRAILQREGVNMLQPISAAPRDGTPFQAYTKDGDALGDAHFAADLQQAGEAIRCLSLTLPERELEPAFWARSLSSCWRQPPPEDIAG